MRVGQIIAIFLWSLGGMVVSYIGLTVVLFFFGLDPVHDLWSSTGLLYAEFIGGGLLLILSGSWVNRKSAERLQSKKAS